MSIKGESDTVTHQMEVINQYNKSAIHILMLGWSIIMHDQMTSSYEIRIWVVV